MRHRYGAFLLGGAVVAAGAAVLIFLTVPQRAAEPDPQAVVRGGRLYAEHCASCHGKALEGQPDWQTRRPDGKLPAPPHDATGHSWHHPDAQLFAVTKEGMGPFAPPGYESDMPAFKDVLSDTEIREIIAFIKSTWPEDIRVKHEKVNAAGDQH